MKTVYQLLAAIFSIILIFICVTIITSCDSGVSTENPSVENKSKTCFTIVDDSDSSPLDSVYVRLTTQETVGRYTLYDYFTGYTDTSGKCCFEIGSSSPFSLLATKRGYLYECPFSGGAPSTVRLKPVAYLQLHIKNIPPNASSDYIGIRYSGETCSGSESLSYEGANVNTTVTVSARPGIQNISWYSQHNNVRIDSIYNNIAMISNDTTFIQILY